MSKSKSKASWGTIDQRYALQEGWAVIYSDGHEREEIQKDDDQKLFGSDEAAKRHVERCAKAGSLLHTRALAYVKACNGAH